MAEMSPEELRARPLPNIKTARGALDAAALNLAEAAYRKGWDDAIERAAMRLEDEGIWDATGNYVAAQIRDLKSKSGI